jgi:hypothetical protein
MKILETNDKIDSTVETLNNLKKDNKIPNIFLNAQIDGIIGHLKSFKDYLEIIAKDAK